MPRRNITLNWADEPFAEGSTRLAYHVNARGGQYGRGSNIVAKVVKASAYNEGIRLSHDDIRAQEVCDNMCEAFNEQHMVDKQLFTNIGHLTTYNGTLHNSDGGVVVFDGESVLLEPLIHGRYEKFNSNSGWSNPSLGLPNFFSHWTWVESGGDYLVCDLQGHRGRPGGPVSNATNDTDYYLFTDPAVMSSDSGGEYGCTDLGMDGIYKWFDHHQCNNLCRRWDLDDHVPSSWMVSSDYAGKGTVYQSF